MRRQSFVGKVETRQRGQEMASQTLDILSRTGTNSMSCSGGLFLYPPLQSKTWGTVYNLHLTFRIRLTMQMGTKLSSRRLRNQGSL